MARGFLEPTWMHQCHGIGLQTCPTYRYCQHHRVHLSLTRPQLDQEWKRVILPTVRLITSSTFHYLTTASSGQLGGATSSDGEGLFGTDVDASMSRYRSSNLSQISLLSASSGASVHPPPSARSGVEESDLTDGEANKVQDLPSTDCCFFRPTGRSLQRWRGAVWN